MNIIIDGLLTSYNKEGTGPAILLIHGWGDRASSFSGLTKVLSDNYTCFSLDLPGFGETQTPDAIWGIKEYSKFVASFIDKLNIDVQAAIGHSNGGTIAIYGLSHKMFDSKKVILLASAGIRDEDGTKKKAYKIIAKTGKRVTKILPKKWQQKAKQKLYKSAGSDIFVAPHLEETFKQVVGYDIQKEAADINIPTLLIYGDLDSETPVRYGEKLHSCIKNSKFIVVHGADHFVHHKKSDLVSREILRFLR